MEEKGAIILAGGKSSRIGQNKAFLKFANSTLIEHLIDKMQEITKEIVLVTNQPELYADFQVKCITDEIKGKGPLGGLHAGLKSSKAWLNFVVACDMPFINPELISYMFEYTKGYDVVVPYVNNKLEPLHAIYSKQCIIPIEKCLVNDQRKLISFYAQVRVKYLTERYLSHFNLAQVFYNINTPDDYQKLKDFNQNEERS